MINPGQGDAGQGIGQQFGPEAGLSQDRTQANAIRPLENSETSRRDVRQRTALLSESNLTDLLDKVAGKEPWPAHVRKHVSSCIEELTRKVEKSLKLTAKKRALVDQANELNSGRIPTGVKSFKPSVEVKELDLPIPAELTELKISFEPGTSFREAKEKLHMATIAMGKMLDARLMEDQITNLRDDLTCDHFVAACGKCSEERSSSADQLMNELGIGTLFPSPTPQFPKAKLTQLYASAMEKVAQNRSLEEAKRQKSEESIAKKVEKLRDSAPHDLLDAKIRASVQEAMGKKAPKNIDASIDYGAAFAMKQSNREDLLRDAIREPPGLEKGGSTKPLFQKGAVPKVKEKKHWQGKGKGKEPTKSGKGKGKSKDSASKGKSKGKKGGSPGGQSGGKGKGSKGAKGKGNRNMQKTW